MGPPFITATHRGFLIGFVGWVAPVPPITALLVLSSLLQPGDVYRSTPGPWLSFVSLCLFAPLLETVLLIVPTVLALRAVQKRWLACLIGCLPVVLLHVADGWQKAVIVLGSFAWAAYCYAVLAEQKESLRTRFWFLAGIHSLGNLIVFGIHAAFGEV